MPVGIAVVEHRGRYLVGIRRKDATLAGCTEFPGGKCLPGELPADCACRECWEETGLKVIVRSLLLRRGYTYPHGDVELFFWLCRPARDEHVRERHGEFVWVSTAELAGLNFPPANTQVIEMLNHRRTSCSA